jgi:hypothetical protein
MSLETYQYLQAKSQCRVRKDAVYPNVKTLSVVISCVLSSNTQYNISKISESVNKAVIIIKNLFLLGPEQKTALIRINKPIMMRIPLAI